MDRPETRYARSGDLAIAFQVHGSGPHDLLVSGAAGSNVETQWNIPEAVRLLERLGQFARVIRYDRRDSGLSDPIRDDLTLEAHANDALAVMDAVGAEHPVVIGAADGARSLALLAATRPTRVGGLIALYPTARGAVASSPEIAETTVQALTDLADWPRPVLELLAPQWMSDPVRRDRLMRYLQTSNTPRQAARVLRMSLMSDISDALPFLQAPTLVVHPRDLSLVSSGVVREFADLVPGATFREIPGDSAFLFTLDVELLADIIEEFVTGNPPTPATSRVLATVLFTDLVDSTRSAARAGDRAWSRVLDRHLEQTRATVAAHGGETIKTTGDGLLALFTGPGQGVRCARQIVQEASGLDLRIRTGLHAGEVERSADDVAGLGVHLAARIMGLAEAGEILVSRTVHDLVIGSDLSFSERGERELKGIPGRWDIFAAS